MKRLAFLFLLVFSYSAFSQIPIINRQLNNYKLIADTSNNFHAFDLRGLDFEENSHSNKSLIQQKNKPIQVFPLLNLGLGNKTFIAGGGVAITLKSKKVSGFFAPSAGIEKLSYLDLRSTIHTKNISGKGFAEPLNGSTYTNIDMPFAINYNPSKFFSLTVGNGRQQIGSGQNSILLSDNSRSHPYAAIQTKVWKLRYTNLYSGYFQQNNSTQLFYNPNKFSTTHYLEFIPNKKFSIGFFETVVFKSSDTLVTRGYDLNYLNPIIFYRPVEYSTGSSDNVLMGLNISYNPFKKFNLFGQFLIDEFLFAYLKADVQHFFNPNANTAQPSGWWANKHAGLMGFKWKEPFSLKGILLHSEISYARPYIFTHLSNKENYGNNNLPLGHHLGANFEHWLTFLTFAKNNLMVEFSYELGKQGLDRNQTENWGSNVNLSYNTRQNEFGNYMLQGFLSTYQKTTISVNYLIIPQVNMSVFGTASFIRQNMPNGFNYQEPLFFIGIKTNLFNNYTQI